MEILSISSEEQLDALINQLNANDYLSSDYSFLKQDGLRVFGWFHLNDELNSIFGNYFIVGKEFYPESSKSFSGIFANLRKYGSSLRHKGIMNAKGEYVIQPNFTDIFDMGEGLLRLGKDGKYGVARIDKGIICPIEYDEIGIVSECVFSVEKNCKLGFIDTLGNTVIPLEYESQKYFKSKFEEGKAYVLQYNELGLYGFYIDHNNNVISDKRWHIDDRKAYIRSYQDDYLGSIVGSDFLDAYEDDESNMWNTD